MSGLRERLRAEDGLSVVELMIVCAMAGMLSLTVMQSLVTTMRTTASVQDRSHSMDDARTALEMIERDVRAANPIDAAAATADYDARISFSIYCSQAGVGDCDSDNLRPVVWRVASNRLERTAGGVTATVLGPDGSSPLAEANRRGAVVNPAGRPVFRYFDANGDLMPTTGIDALPPEQFRYCAKEVRIVLIANAETAESPSTIELQTSATLRNFHEVDGC